MWYDVLWKLANHMILHSFFFFLKMVKAFIKTKKEIQIHKGLQKQNQHRRIKLNKHPNGLTMKGKGGVTPIQSWEEPVLRA